MINAPTTTFRRRPPPPLVFWILWVAFLGSITVYQVELGGGLPHGGNAGPQALNLPVVLGAVQFVVAALIRWIVIPKVTDGVRLLPLMVVGLALSESLTFYGIFLVASNMPQTQLAFLVASFFGVLQFAPFYAPPRDLAASSSGLRG